MKSRAVLIIAVILGLFTYSLPLYASSNNEYHVEEKTVIKIPIVGPISTHTSSYLSGCKLKENSTIKLHNSLVKMMSDSDGKSYDVLLSDMCEEIQWKYDEGLETYTSTSFEDIREAIHQNDEDSEIQIDMESDQNDIDDLPRMTHEILGYEKNINGFKAQKVLTTVYPKGADHPIIIEEYYTTKAKALSKISQARENLAQKLGYGEGHVDGVPDLIKVSYEAIRKDLEWDRPDGEVVRFVIQVEDDDGDPIFTMNYDVLKAEIIAYQADHFALK